MQIGHCRYERKMGGILEERNERLSRELHPSALSRDPVERGVGLTVVAAADSSAAFPDYDSRACIFLFFVCIFLCKLLPKLPLLLITPANRLVLSRCHISSARVVGYFSKE